MCVSECAVELVTYSLLDWQLSVPSLILSETSLLALRNALPIRFRYGRHSVDYDPLIKSQLASHSQL